jgi:putative hydrolase of the HAD superfamily
MNKIENIIFDFGGVLYHIDLNRSINAFKNMGIDFAVFKDELLSVFIDLEVGKISPDIFINRIRPFISENVSDQDIIHAFNLVLDGIDANRIDFIRKISQKFKLFLLST